MIREIYAAVHEQGALLRVVTDQVTRHDKSLYGNGRPGLCQVLDQVATRQMECQERQKNSRATLPAWVSIVVAVGGIVVSVILSLRLNS